MYPGRSRLVAHLGENFSQAAIGTTHGSRSDIQQIVRPTRWNQGARVDQGFTRPRRGVHRNEAGYEPPVIGDTKLLAGLNSGEVTRRMLAELPNSYLLHTLDGSTSCATRSDSDDSRVCDPAPSGAILHRPLSRRPPTPDPDLSGPGRAGPARSCAKY